MISIMFQILWFIAAVYSQNCDTDYDIRLNTIILTHPSQKNGANFLRKIATDSLEECIKQCCDASDCTAGVFGPKPDRACFLFDCQRPNVCNFTSESDYTVFVRHSTHEDSPRIHKVSPSPPGSLRGRCGPHKLCSTENSICDSGQCVCKAGFIEKKGKCVRSICGKPNIQFQCDDATACIAIYDVCNGIQECSDGSDEALCDKVEASKTQTTPVRSTPSPKVGLLSADSELTFEALKPAVENFVPERRVLPRHEEDERVLELPQEDFDSRTFELTHDLPVRQRYQTKKAFSSPSYPYPLEQESPVLLMPRRSSLMDYLGLPRRDIPIDLLDEPENEDKVYDRDRYLSRPRYSSSRHHDGDIDFDEVDSEELREKYENSRHPSEVHKNKHRFLRRKMKNPPVEHSNPKSGAKREAKDVKAESMTSEKKALDSNSIGPYAQSGYQWHTAAILLAISLGVTSCLFGILVGQCRRRGRFDKEGPRSKAVATSQLRRRIQRTRNLSQNELEKNGLLSRLQL